MTADIPRARVPQPLAKSLGLLTILVIVGRAEIACTPIAAGPPDARGLEPLLLAPCHLNRLSEEVLCATHEVFEDRQAKAGRRIPVRVAVLPALRRTTKPDPLFMMAGGPGQGAGDLGAVAARFFKNIRRTREIVLVDLRGTGDSSTLTCPTPDDELSQIQTGVSSTECLRGLTADPRHCTHAEALADLDEIRQRLGYGQINLWGGSWGTRAALLYALMYPDAIRSLVLDGAVPLDLEFPRTAAHDAQRAFDLLVESCAQDARCAAMFPAIRSSVDALLEKFERGPVAVIVRHPRTGATASVALRREALAEIIRVALYTPSEASRLPQTLRHAEAGDFSPLFAQAARSASISTDSMALGVTMSILCSEDWPQVAGVDFATESGGTLFRHGYADAWRSRCESWPTGAPIGFDQAATSPAPALILSGNHDPVTPPQRGERMTAHFPRSRHVIVAGGAHNVSFTGCVPDVIAGFIDAPNVKAVDATCAEETTFPPMVTR